MGIREEIQADLAEAFDTDLADAVQLFTGGVTLPGTWDPVTEESTGEVVVAYSGRWPRGHSSGAEPQPHAPAGIGDRNFTRYAPAIQGVHAARTPSGQEFWRALPRRRERHPQMPLSAPARPIRKLPSPQSVHIRQPRRRRRRRACRYSLETREKPAPRLSG